MNGCRSLWLEAVDKRYGGIGDHHAQNAVAVMLARSCGSTYSHIGRALGLSRERIRQIDRGGHRRVRELYYGRQKRRRAAKVSVAARRHDRYHRVIWYLGKNAVDRQDRCPECGEMNPVIGEYQGLSIVRCPLAPKGTAVWLGRPWRPEMGVGTVGMMIP